MMYSVPDTPFGQALGHFLRLFEQRPMELATLHAAFADLAALAARDHPDRPWPMKMNEGNGRNATFTVEELLANMRELYANQPAVDVAVVAEKLLGWHGAQVQDFVACGGLNPYLRLDISQRVGMGPRKFRMKPLGTLAADCTWKLLRAQQLLGASTDAGPRARAVFSKALKGTAVLETRLETAGALVITFTKSFLLEVRPDAFSIKPDYLLVLPADIYSCFDGGFIAEKLSFMEEDGEAASAPPAV